MFTIQFRKVVCSFLPVGFPSSEHVIVDDENAMADRNSGTFVATPCRNLMILGSKVRVLGSCCGLGCLHQDGFADPSAKSFASTLIVAWADAHPGGEMGRIGKSTQIPAHLRKQDLDDPAATARDDVKLLDQRIIGA